MSEICVSIFMLTYNQEEYISQAIEGVLMQQTKFRYELVIGEDSSTDGTRKICKEYTKNYPEKIKLLLNKKNLGIGANYVKTYAQCTGKYVAICDGDDYWVDPLKLQKQVDILETNSNYKIIYTNNFSLLPTGSIIGPKESYQKKIAFFEDIIFGNFIASVTVMFKNKPLDKYLNEEIAKLPYGDWPTYLWVLRNDGEIYFLNEPTAIYRRDFGTSAALRVNKSKLGEVNLKILKILLNKSEFNNKKEIIRKSIIQHSLGIMASYNKDKEFIQSLNFLSRLVFRTNPLLVLRLYAYSLKRTFNF